VNFGRRPRRGRRPSSGDLDRLVRRPSRPMPAAEPQRTLVGPGEACQKGMAQQDDVWPAACADQLGMSTQRAAASNVSRAVALNAIAAPGACCRTRLTTRSNSSSRSSGLRAATDDHAIPRPSAQGSNDDRLDVVASVEAEQAGRCAYTVFGEPGHSRLDRVCHRLGVLTDQEPDTDRVRRRVGGG